MNCNCGHAKNRHDIEPPFECYACDDCKSYSVPHICNGVDGAARHGIANRCSLCGKNRSGRYTKEPKQ